MMLVNKTFTKATKDIASKRVGIWWGISIAPTYIRGKHSIEGVYMCALPCLEEIIGLFIGLYV
jgi:hypothetical protein